MARVFWVAVGAAAGVWAYKRGEAAMAAARERSALENLQVASQTATKVAAVGAKVVAGAGVQGARLAARLAPKPEPDPEPAPALDPAPERAVRAAPPPDDHRAGT